MLKYPPAIWTISSNAFIALTKQEAGMLTWANQAASASAFPLPRLLLHNTKEKYGQKARIISIVFLWNWGQIRKNLLQFKPWKLSRRNHCRRFITCLEVPIGIAVYTWRLKPNSCFIHCSQISVLRVINFPNQFKCTPCFRPAAVKRKLCHDFDRFLFCNPMFLSKYQMGF